MTWSAGSEPGPATIAGVALCPHPPLLVPSLAAGAAPEADTLRAACDAAIARLVAAEPELIVIVGADAAGQGDPATGLRGFAPGLPGLPDLPGSGLPLSLAIGEWLLDRVASSASIARRLIGVRADGTPANGWPDLNGRVGLLVMGDGSARHGEKSPGYLDERAAPFDAAIVKALADADLDALAALDPEECAELWVAGAGAWKALAALAARESRAWAAEVLYDDAPYGVQYTVATWLRP